MIRSSMSLPLTFEPGMTGTVRFAVDHAAVPSISTRIVSIAPFQGVSARLAGKAQVAVTLKSVPLGIQLANSPIATGIPFTKSHVTK